jgi:hypothetical protein
MTDLLQREVGWLITKEHAELEDIESRVGWGQLRVHAGETDSSYGQALGRTVFMDKSLTEHMISEDKQVRWRSFEDDGIPAFDGLVNVDWLFDDDDLAYNIDRFNEADVGATHVWYSVNDIIKCAKKQPLYGGRWEQFASRNPGAVLPRSDADDRWIQIYC